jgi:hypothetical protein
MASNKQLEANRANARKSTGPRSQGGKARSRLNSRKHGLTAKTLIIVGERSDDFDQLRAELMDEHDPQSASECELVERLAGILWRLRRVPFFEAAILTTRQAHVVHNNSFLKVTVPEGLSDEECRARSVGEALILDGSFHDIFGKLTRYEATLMNAFTKTLQMLLLLQENRGTEPVILETVAAAA